MLFRRPQYLLYALEKGGMNYRCKKDLIHVEDENSVASASLALKTYLDDISKKIPGVEIIVNITGGTKPLSIGAYIESEKRGLELLYISESDQTKALDMMGGYKPLTHNITIAEFLGGYGYSVLNDVEMAKEEEQAMQTAKLAATLASKIDDKCLWENLGKLRELKKDDDEILLSKENNIFIEDFKLREQIVRQFSLLDEGSCLVGKIKGKDVLFLTGKWLEVFIWALLNPLVGTAIWDLHLNCKFGKNDMKGQTTDNEWDVIFMRDQSLCIIECKTGNLSQYSSSGSDLIYEIAGIKSQLQALRVKTYLVTTSEKVKGKEEIIKKDLLLRSTAYDCDIIPAWEIRNLANQYIDEKKPPTGNVFKTFFKRNARHL
jgi:hypothetical protein